MYPPPTRSTGGEPMRLGRTQKALLYFLELRPETTGGLVVSSSMSSRAVHSACRRLEDRSLVRRVELYGHPHWEITALGRVELAHVS